MAQAAERKQCETCLEEMQRRSKKPNETVTLPLKIVQHKTFKYRDKAVTLCPYCDGDALERALATHGS